MRLPAQALYRRTPRAFGERQEVYRILFVDDEKPVVAIGDRDIAIGIPSQQRELTNMMIPMGRPGTPEEAAGSVFMLCMPEARYVSGQIIVCGGGI